MKTIRFLTVFAVLSVGLSIASSCSVVRYIVKKENEKYERYKIETNNKKVRQALQEGGAAYDAKNYDLAVAKFDEGYQADPDFPGSAPVLLNNKALTLVVRGTELYNKSVKSDAETKNIAREAAKKDFNDAVGASERALQILKGAAANQENRKHLDFNTLLALTNRKSAYRLLAQTGIDRTRGKEALAAFREYLAVEADEAKKSKAQLDLALTLQDSDQFELSIFEFKKILDLEPNNTDALAGIGLNLVKVGYEKSETEKLREAEIYLKKYIEVAPDSHKYKEEVKGIIEVLKETDNPRPPLKSFSNSNATVQSSGKRKNYLIRNQATILETGKK